MHKRVKERRVFTKVKLVLGISNFLLATAITTSSAAAKTVKVVCGAPMMDKQFTIDYDAMTVTGSLNDEFHTVPAQFTDQTIRWTLKSDKGGVEVHQDWSLDRATGQIRLSDDFAGTCHEVTNKF
jgi:hypothetical protein